MEAVTVNQLYTPSSLNHSKKLKSFHATVVFAHEYDTLIIQLPLRIYLHILLQNSDLWIYSKKENVKIHGKENLTGYEFLHKDSLHSFCKICGVSVLVEVTEPGSNIVPINVRTINGIDLGSLRLKKYDGKANDPQYIVH